MTACSLGSPTDSGVFNCYAPSMSGAAVVAVHNAGDLEKPWREMLSDTNASKEPYFAGAYGFREKFVCIQFPNRIAIPTVIRLMYAPHEHHPPLFLLDLTSQILLICRHL